MSFLSRESSSLVVSSCLRSVISLSLTVSFLSRESSSFASRSLLRSSGFAGSVSFFSSSLLGLIATSTVRPSDVTTSPLELMRTSIFDPSVSRTVPKSPVSSIRISATSLSAMSTATVFSSLRSELAATGGLSSRVVVVCVLSTVSTRKSSTSILSTTMLLTSIVRDVTSSATNSSGDFSMAPRRSSTGIDVGT